MQKQEYTVKKNIEIAKGIFELTLDAPDIARIAQPGQFANFYLSDSERLLPRPLCIVDAVGNDAVFVFATVGAGTLVLSRLQSGDKVSALAPLGHGFFDYENSLAEDKYLLIGGGTGSPALRFAARRIRETKANAEISVFLGFAGEPWGIHPFEAFTDKVFTASEESGRAAFTGNVVALLEQYATQANADLSIKQSPDESRSALPYSGGLALSCGPAPMLAAAAKFCAEKNIPLRVCLEERMACGYGACYACSRPVKDSNGNIVRKKVCTHGPCFWANEIFF